MYIFLRLVVSDLYSAAGQHQQLLLFSEEGAALQHVRRGT
jgi:hypothetical protein